MIIYTKKMVQGREASGCVLKVVIKQAICFVKDEPHFLWNDAAEWGQRTQGHIHMRTHIYALYVSMCGCGCLSVCVCGQIWLPVLDPARL